MRHPLNKRRSLVVFWAGIAVMALAAALPPRVLSTPRKQFRMANLPSIFIGHSVKEGRLAMKMIVKKIFQPQYPDLKLQVDFLTEDNLQNLLKAIIENRYDALVLTIVQMKRFFPFDRQHVATTEALYRQQSASFQEGR